MRNIFSVKILQFPYKYKFPGQASDEVILFATRENPLMLKLRQFGLLLASLFLLITGWWLSSVLGPVLGAATASLSKLVVIGIVIVFVVIGWWWVTSLWKKSMAFVTNKRMSKLIYTTPVSRYSLSLPLEMIADTGAYAKGFLQALLKLGTFTARSSAASSGVATDSPDRVNKKYFYIENIARAEDLQQYVNKLLSLHRKDKDLTKFRPFIPHLKGETRKEFMKRYPEYWS